MAKHMLCLGIGAWHFLAGCNEHCNPSWLQYAGNDPEIRSPARRSVEIIRAFTALECSEITIPKDPLEIISLQARMISTLAEEIYKSRKQIENHDQQIASLDFRLSHLETSPIALPGQRISSSQCSILQSLVKEKARSKKQMIQLWFAFKKHFDLTRYVHLPKNKFEEACSWIKNYSPKN